MKWKFQTAGRLLALLALSGALLAAPLPAQAAPGVLTGLTGTGSKLELELTEMELEITDEALHAIARKTIERKTGARGLRSVMENILMPIMYDVPNDPTIIRVTIDEDTVEGGEAHLEYGAVRKRYKNQAALS